LAVLDLELIMHEANGNRNLEIPRPTDRPFGHVSCPASNIGVLFGECAAKDCAEVVDHFLFLWKLREKQSDTSPRIPTRAIL
jgi:hypothetical protein